MAKDSFVFYKSWADILATAPDEVRLRIYDAIVHYATTGEVLPLDPVAMMAFKFIRHSVDKEEVKWDETRAKRSEAGKRGNEKRWHTSQTETNIANATVATKISQTSQEVTNIANIAVNVNGSSNEEEKESNLTVTKEKIKLTLEEKIKKREQGEQEFWQELQTYIPLYGEEMIKDFYRYWTEPTKNLTQNRKGQQKTWLTAGRLATWNKNNQRRYHYGTGTTPTGGNRAEQERNEAVQQFVLDSLNELK